METRKGLRVDINLGVTLEIVEGLDQKFLLKGGNRFEAATCNINEEGIGILVKYFLPGGLIVEMELEGAPFGLKEFMKVKGEVRYCKYIKLHEYKCGIKFLDIPEKYRKAISHFIYTHKR